MAGNAQNYTKLTGKQLKAISLLMTGLDQATVVRKIGVREYSISRWKEQLEFKEELQRQKRETSLQNILEYFYKSSTDPT